MKDLKEMQEKMKQLKNERQEARMKRILDLVEVLCEEANKKGYEPSDKERQDFSKVLNIINNMNEWF